MTYKLLFPVDSKPASRSTAGDDESLGLNPDTINFDAVDTAVMFVFFYGAVLEAGSEAFGLGMHFHDQLRAVDSFWEAGKILNLCGCGELAARLPPLQHEWREIGATGVDGCGETGTTGADNDDLFHKSVGR